MADHSQQIGARFEEATLQLFKHLFPLLGWDVIYQELRRSGSQSGFDIFFQTRPAGIRDVRINFFVECKGAQKIELLPPDKFQGKPELLKGSLYNPDY